MRASDSYAPCPQDLHPGRLLLGVAEQDRLADPGFTHHGKDTAAAGPGIVEQPTTIRTSRSRPHSTDRV